MTFRHGTIIGLGLLGGSLALDWRAHFPDMAITGVARRADTREMAAGLRHGGAPVFTHLSGNLSAAHAADLVVLCTPVQTIIEQLAALAPQLTPGTVVTDVGSTKRAIMNAATTLAGTGVRFIGGHPMAGSERVGLSRARAGLYRGATWALCVPPGQAEAAAALSGMLATIGARPLEIDAETHDGLVAATSHLPHVLAAALSNVVLGGDDPAAARTFIAGGFRDVTRIAAGHPVMWRDILLTNRDQVLATLDRFSAELEGWRQAIRGGDSPHLEALLTMAQVRRQGIE